VTTPVQFARAMHAVLEPINSIAYFAPELASAWERVGLEPRGQGYFAGRAAPFGPTAAGPVAAAFFNFNPRLVEMVVPAVWDVATPEQVLAARAEGLQATLEALEVPTDGVAEATELARRAAGAGLGAGRPLAAANLGVEPSGLPLADLWLAVTVLREHRGDGHVALLVASGLSPLESLALYAAWQGRVSRRFLQKTRGWDDEAWQRGLDGLAEGGLVDGEELTAEGHGLRDQLEERTDELAIAPWQHLGEDDSRRLWDLLQPIALATAAGFPRPYEVPTRFPV
jgi:hypothetical protein